MKRHTQFTGVRDWAGDDLLELQSEPLKALDTFFAQYGPCVIEGCETTDNGDGTCAVSAGLLALEAEVAGADPAERRVLVMPFEGVESVVLPAYFTPKLETIEELYNDGLEKPIIYRHYAVITDDAAGLEIGLQDPDRFVDVLQDPKHRFITDQEREQWNQILSDAKEYFEEQERQLREDMKQADEQTLQRAKDYTNEREGQIRGDMTTGLEANLRASKEYTDQREEIIRANYAEDDQIVLDKAKDYADRVVEALVDGSPEALDTLKELAEALGNDPNFATTVMTEIGKRATTESMNAALAKKADKAITLAGYGITDGVSFRELVNGESLDDLRSSTGFWSAGGGNMVLDKPDNVDAFGVMVMRSASGYWTQLLHATNKSEGWYYRFYSTSWTNWKTLWSSENFDPDSKMNVDDGFQNYAGNIQAADRDIFALLPSGAYCVIGGADQRILLNFNMGQGSTSALQLYSNYQNTEFMVRTQVDSNRHTDWARVYTDKNYTSIPAATESAAGLFTGAEKKKLEGIAANANNYVHPADELHVTQAEKTTLSNLAKAPRIVCQGCFGETGIVDWQRGEITVMTGQGAGANFRRIYHNLGHSNYTMSIVPLLPNLTAYSKSYTVVLSGVTSWYFDVGIVLTTSQEAGAIPFYFTIFAI